MGNFGSSSLETQSFLGTGIGSSIVGIILFLVGSRSLTISPVGGRLARFRAIGGSLMGEGSQVITILIWIGLLLILFGIVFFGLFAWSLIRDSESVDCTMGECPPIGGEPQEVDGDVFRSIGGGILLDREGVRDWLNTSEWRDKDGYSFPVDPQIYRNLVGYSPPSFAYLPEGQLSKSYNPTNYKEGRMKCFEACKETNCLGVQTEVPQNCYQRISIVPGTTPTGRNGMPQKGEYTNSCGGSSTHSCTLYYPNIVLADDAYYQLYQKDPTLVGQKYYVDEISPQATPQIGVPPSQAEVGWCREDIPNREGRVWLSLDSQNPCSCVDGSPCNDPKCCLSRPLNTMNAGKASYPLYDIPMDVTQINIVCPSEYVNPQGGREACGDMGDGTYRSCRGIQCSKEGDRDCYRLDRGRVSCIGDMWDPDSDEVNQCLENFKENGGTDMSKLLECCYYRNKACIKETRQPHCNPLETKRGCFGSQDILVVGEVGGSGPLNQRVGACSDTSIIPSDKRCVNQPDTEVCLDFPYSCSDDPRAGGRLWVRSGNDS